MSARTGDRGIDPRYFAGRFDLRVQSVYTISLGAGVILSALLLQVLYAGRGGPFGAQLVFALHVCAPMCRA